MMWRHVSFLIGGFLLGAVVVIATGRDDGAVKSVAKGSVASISGGNGLNEHLQRDQRIAELTNEVQELRAKLAAASTAEPVPPPRTLQDFQKESAGMAERARAMIERAQTASLLAAGFSQARIDWLRTRTSELRVEQDRRAHQGRMDQLTAMTYLMDPDLELAGEIGEEEYDKYRKALARPNGIGLDQVLPASSAELAGLRPGDEIVGYAGTRVYNEPMMNALIKANGSASTTLEVMRDGRKIALPVRGGPLGIRAVPISTAGMIGALQKNARSASSNP